MKRELGGDAGGSGMGGAKRPRQDNRGRDITLRFLLQSKVKFEWHLESERHGWKVELFSVVLEGLNASIFE